MQILSSYKLHYGLEGDTVLFNLIITDGDGIIQYCEGNKSLVGQKVLIDNLTIGKPIYISQKGKEGFFPNMKMILTSFHVSAQILSGNVIENLKIFANNLNLEKNLL